MCCYPSLVKLFLVFYLPSFFEPGISSFGLKIKDFSVPSKVVIGDRVWLNCSYDLESDQLYSIKWYKDSEEIYRFLPSFEPQRKKFPTEGLNLDLSKSREGNVYISISDGRGLGDFRCEVSADAPTFQTKRQSKLMRVFRSHEEAESSGRRVKFWDPFITILMAVTASHCLSLYSSP